MASFRKERFIDTEETLTKFGDPNIAFKNAFTASNLNIQTVLKLLNTERQSSGLYNYVWQQAEKHFGNKKTALKNKSKVAMPDECHIAVIAYALDTSYNGKKLYQDFNARSRRLTSDASWDAFPYKSMYCLLMRSAEGVNSNPPINSHAYRGVSFHYSKTRFSIGQEVCFNQFTSSSANSSVADFFKGGKGTIIEFPTGAKEAIGIDDYSPYAESEILIFPWSTFKITSWEQNGQNHRIVLESGQAGADDSWCTIA